MLALILIVPAALYVPSVQSFVSSRVVDYLNSTQEDMVFSLEKIRIGFPLKLKIYNLNAMSKVDGKVLAGVGKVVTSLDDIPYKKDYFLVKNFSAEDIVLGFDSLTESILLKGKIDRIDVSDLYLRLDSSIVDIDKIVIDLPDITVAMGPSQPDSLEEESDLEWKINVNKILALRGFVKFDMSDESLIDAANSSNISPYLDYNHLNFSSLSLGVDDFAFRQNDISCNIINFYGVEKNCDLNITHLDTRFHMQGNVISVEDIDFKMPETSLSGDFAIDLALLDSLREGYASTDLKGKISHSDLIKIAAPYLPELEENWPEEASSFRLNAYVSPDTVDLKDLYLEIADYTDFSVKGFGLYPFSNKDRKIKGTIKGDLTDSDFLLTTFVAKPEDREYHLPPNLFVEIDATYRKNYAEGEFFVKQNGTVVAEGRGKYNMETEQYDLKAMTNRLKLTDFVPSTGIDGVSTHVVASGRHFKLPSKYTTFDINLQLDTLLYNNGKGERDSLFDVSVVASLLKNKYYAQITSGHPYLMLDTQLEGEWAKDQVSAQGYIDLAKLDLMHLPQIVAADLGEISLQSDIMGSYDYGDNAYADIFIHTMTYDDGVQIHPFNEIDLRFDSKPEKLSATFESGDATFFVNADKSIADVLVSVDSVMTEINRQIDRTSIDVPQIQKHLPKFSGEMEILRNNSFYPIADALGYRFRQIKSTFSNDETFSFQFRILGLNTAEQHIDTVQIRFRPESDPKVYDYKFHASYSAPKAADSYMMDGKGAVYKDSISACFEYENGKYIKMYDVDASLAMAPDTLRLRFTEDPLIYSQRFTVNEDNYIQVSQFKDLEAQALAIEADLDLDNDQGLCVNLMTNKKDSIGNEVHLKVDNLNMANLARTLALGVDVGGTLNSRVDVDLLPNSMQADLTTDISRFHIGDYKADTLVFKGIASNDEGNIDLAGKLTIDQLVKLDLLANVADSVDVNVGIRELPLPLVNGFLPSNIQLQGETSGEILINGKDFDSATFNGFLSMHDALVNYADCDANIYFPNDTVSIRRNRLRFRDYRLKGANNNPVTMRGSVDFTQSLTDPDINLTLKGENTQIFNNKRRKNKQQYIYGTLPANIDLTVKGKVTDLDVKGNISAIDGTNLVYYLEDDPLSSASKVDELVDFVRFREVDRILPDRIDRPLNQTGSKDRLDVNLKLNIVNNAKVYVHLPTNEKDHVSLIGGGSLTLQAAADGSMVMSGLYDIKGGDLHYKLPMIPVSKDFDLSDQSWISWNGDVEDPNINLIAVEKVKSTVNDQAGARVVNFDVYINISGTLNSLDIAFNCDAPDDGNISSELSTLTDEERSKQALLLLIAQTYMGPGSNSSVGLASANAALNSILNKELESLLTNKLKNTDIDLGIDTYDADGATRTDYSVKVSQRLFNDRMRVTLGGKISSGQEVAPGQNDAMINDVSLEYLFKSDGSTYARLFRKTNYENVLEGEVVESGIGYVQQRSGFRFRNLLIPNNKKREAALRQQIKEMQEAEQEAERASRRRSFPTFDSAIITNVNDSIQKKDSVVQSPVVVDSLAVDSLQLHK